MKEKEIIKLRTATMRAENVAVDALKNTSRSPIRGDNQVIPLLEQSIRSKYLTNDESHSKHFDEAHVKLRELESFKISLESENKSYLT